MFGNGYNTIFNNELDVENFKNKIYKILEVKDSDVFQYGDQNGSFIEQIKKDAFPLL